VRPLKAILRNEGVRWVLCRIAGLYVRLVWLTGRWTIEGDAVPEARWRQGQPFLLAFWHGRLLMMPYCWRRGQPIHMVISEHRDGRLIANTMKPFGIDSIQGSSSRGGVEALRVMKKTVKAGHCIGITPDGPRGPRMRASVGIVRIARMTGVPVIPATYGASRGRTLASWDRFLVPRPFTRGVILWGAPIEVTAKDDIEAKRQEIEEALTALQQEADRRTGRAPIDPAATSAPRSEDVAEGA
jgi:lysophospholipid acyltransferase (LPLAT)-like uncharacterized protein